MLRWCAHWLGGRQGTSLWRRSLPSPPPFLPSFSFSLSPSAEHPQKVPERALFEAGRFCDDIWTTFRSSKPLQVLTTVLSTREQYRLYYEVLVVVGRRLRRRGRGRRRRMRKARRAGAVLRRRPLRQRPSRRPAAPLPRMRRRRMTTSGCGRLAQTSAPPTCESW